MVRVSPKDFDLAVKEGVLSLDQSLKLQDFMEKRTQRAVDSTYALYALGGLAILAALGYLLFDQWMKKQVLVLLLSFGGLSFFFSFSAYYFQKIKNSSIIAGILSILGLIATYGFVTFLMTFLGWEAPLPAGIGHLKTELILLRNPLLPPLVALGIALIMRRLIAFPFLIFAILYLFDDVFREVLSFIIRYEGWAPLQAQCMTCPPYDMLAKAGIITGAIALYVAYRLDWKSNKSEAFWAYLFGAYTISLSISSLGLLFTESHGTAILSLVIHMSLIALSVFLGRAVLMVFGLFGIFDHILYLFSRVYPHSVFFPYMIIGVGVGTLFLAISYKKNQTKLEMVILNHLPQSLIALRPTAPFKEVLRKDTL
ncbi:MAG: hypothetical protein IPJ69_11040 [Deltaproteobacteria bacterium]|nr:MAG: hypothetical protein IPJ69_11040 [Deltaproteobacteria bacterium]